MRPNLLNPPFFEPSSVTWNSEWIRGRKWSIIQKPSRIVGPRIYWNRTLHSDFMPLNNPPFFEHLSVTWNSEWIRGRKGSIIHKPSRIVPWKVFQSIPGYVFTVSKLLLVSKRFIRGIQGSVKPRLFLTGNGGQCQIMSSNVQWKNVQLKKGGVHTHYWT